MKRIIVTFSIVGLLLVIFSSPLVAKDIPTFTTKNLKFLQRTPGQRGNPYLESLTSSLRKADSSIIVYQYLIIGQDYDKSVQEVLSRIKEKALDGVDVQFYMSESRKNRVGEPLNASVQDFFGTAPVRIKLLSDETSLHSKVVLIDTHTAFVGSQNWSPAGLRKNVEIGVRIRNKRFVQYLRNHLEKSLKHIWPEEFGFDRNQEGKEESGQSKQLSPDSLDLETVTQNQLEQIPGIGPTYAERIIKYREENRFATIEDLEGVSGIGGSRLDKLEKYFKE